MILYRRTYSALSHTAQLGINRSAMPAANERLCHVTVFHEFDEEMFFPGYGIKTRGQPPSSIIAHLLYTTIVVRVFFFFNKP